MLAALRGIVGVKRMLERATVERRVLAEALRMQLHLGYGEKYEAINDMQHKLRSVEDGSIHEDKGEGQDDGEER